MDSYLAVLVLCCFSVVTIWADHEEPGMSHGSPSAFQGFMGASKNPFGVVTKGGCPNFKPQEGFNKTRLAGTWYVYEGNRPAHARGMKCPEFNLTPRPDGHIDLRMAGIREVTVFGYTMMKVRVKIHGDLQHVDGATFSLSTSGYHDLEHANYNVVATDYETFAVMHNCYKIPMMPLSVQVASIMTRERGMPPKNLDKIHSKLSEYNVDVSKFTKMDQADCTVPYEDTMEFKFPRLGR